MSKIICDICGTSYPETADQCPICGCSKDMSAQSLADELMEEEMAESAEPARKKGRFAAAAKSKKAPAPVEEDPYEDEEDDDDIDDDDDDDDFDDDDDEENDHKSNGPLVVLLVIVIVALIAVSGFIFVRYVMPYILNDEPTTPVVTTLPEESTDASVPCSNLALTSGGEATLKAEGDHWLINVMALPENTTDKIVYASSDENVAIVNEQGKVTAVGEGTAVITITCGQQQLTCTVTCDFTEEETTAPTEEPTEAPTEEPTEAPEPTEPLKDINLEKAISHLELTFNGPNQGYTFRINGLKNTEVKWSSEDETIVTVDENGRVLNHGKGVTYIICQYGDQIVKIKIISQW